MRLYNSLSQELERVSLGPSPVSVYVCGITPYDATHLGHAFTYTSLDLLVRYLEFSGYEVRYVQNVTDVDDDILRKADEVGEDWKELGDRWTARFIEDMIALNVRPPDRFPRATDTIPEIIAVVQALVDAGCAYQSGGSVYFHIDAWPEYGKLSRLGREEMLPIANERGNDPDDPHKRDPLDFVLWQADAPGEPAWESPWGPGRPGWHIECSTMAIRLLGVPIDIHSGGADLLFPHHESEIAQAEAACGTEPFVRYWVHTAMVHHDGEKMSKSLGNLVMARDLLQRWEPDVLRLYLASHHYRKAWNHDEEELEQAAGLWHALVKAVQVDGGSYGPLDGGRFRASFVEAMEDDLDVPTAISHLRQLADAIGQAAEDGRAVAAAQETLRSLGTLLGLRLDAAEPEARVREQWQHYLERFT